MNAFSKRILFACTLLASSLPGLAFAADPLLPETNWDGWYAGSIAGYAFGNAEIVDTGNGIWFPGDSYDHKPEGYLTGLALGRNWQGSDSNFVFGVEGDVSALHINQTDFFNDQAGIQTIISGMGTLRGRVGYAGERFHLYGTGGLALAHIAQFGGDSDCDPGLGSSCDGWIDDSSVFNTGDWKLGWTAGVGAEYRAFGNWIVRGEYLYADLGSYGAVGPDDPANKTATFSNDIHLARLGLIRQFGAGEQGDAGDADWAGPYAGIVAGYAFGNSKMSGDDAADGLDEFAGDSFGHKPDGLIGGLVSGYSIMPFDNGLVLGVEGDVSLADIDQTDFEGASDIGIQTVISTLSTARAKLGFAHESFHVFATGGLASGHITQFAGLSQCDADPGNSCDGWVYNNALFNTGKWKFGWTAGAGAETRIAGNWRARAEYLYVDLGSYEAKVPDTADEFGTFHNNLHIARAGLILDF